MDFLIMLGFKFLFDLLYPAKNITQKGSNNVEAAFWFGTSYENLDSSEPTKYNSEDFSKNSEYDQTW
jgi:hypothetical protein